MLVAPTSHPDLPTHFTHLTHRVSSISRSNTMSDLSSRAPRKPPGHTSRRLKRHDSAISTSTRSSSTHSLRGPLIDLNLSVNNRRSRSPRRGTQDFWAGKSADLPNMLPIYEPRPVLHREDAFKVVEAAPAARCGLREDSYEDELEFCTTQFPEFGEECMYDYWP